MIDLSPSQAIQARLVRDYGNNWNIRQRSKRKPIKPSAQDLIDQLYREDDR